MKKIIKLQLISILLLSTTSGNCENFYKTGLYTGVAIGYSHMSTNISEKFYNPNPVPCFEINKKKKKHGYLGEFKLGYRYFITTSQMLGFEIAGQLGRKNKTNNDFTTFYNTMPVFKVKNTVHNQYKILPVLVIGQKINTNILGFVKIGPSFSKFKVNQVRTLNYGNRDLSINNLKKKSTGLLIGAGTEYAFTKNISATFEVAHERYKKMNFNYKTDAQAPLETDTGRIKPSITTFKLGVLYKFDNNFMNMFGA